MSSETHTFEADDDALQRVITFIESHIPCGLGPIIHTKTCLYTMPPDRDFVVDSVPGADNVLVALGAAHGFKVRRPVRPDPRGAGDRRNTSADIRPPRSRGPSRREEMRQEPS